MSALLGLVTVVGCSGNAVPEYDSGRPPRPDAGPQIDATTETPPPQQVRVRVAMSVPGLTGTATAPTSADLCLWTAAAGSVVTAIPPQWPTGAAGTIPFRGVTPYLPLSWIEGIDYVFALYDAAVLRVAGACPEEPDAIGAPPYVLRGTLESTSVEPDGSYTLAMSGLVPGTLGAEGSALPSVCETYTALPNWNSACPDDETTRARAFLYRDDNETPASGTARVRLANLLSNLAPVDLDLCFDVDLTLDPTTGLPVDGSAPPETLFSDVPAHTSASREDGAPLAPGGSLYLQLADPRRPTPCAPFAPEVHGNFLPLLPAFPAGREPPVANIVPSVEAGAVVTIYVNGILGVSGDPSATLAPAILLWRDNLSSDD